MTAFPKAFLWGAASASYQVEGGVREDGRGESIWDVFSHTPGLVRHGDTGDTAADSYHRWMDDVALLKEMGLGAYRFSLAWPRIAPSGDTNWNKLGFDYYDRIVDALLEAGIQPWVTLYHWDLPQVLQSRGGWQNRETVQAYAAYAAEAGRHFQGRVTRWFTFNEPQCFINLGCASGEHAPGLRLDDGALEVCWENFRLAHSLAADALHGIDGENQAGLASTGAVCYPASDSPADIEAARQLTFALPQGVRMFSHTLALDPLCLEGRYTKPDFIGINLYHGTAARMGKNGPEEVPYPTGGPRTAIGWPITPEALEWGPRFLAQRYGLPLYVSENGLSCCDQVFLDGQVHDPQRVDFLARYLQALSRAMESGTDVRGYFHWSLTDNFEWAEGYDQRFGLAYVDYATGNRILKDSGRWYGCVAGQQRPRHFLSSKNGENTMPISYNASSRVFRLDTPRTTYLCGLVGRENFLGHIYYGPSIPGDDLRCLLRLDEKPFTPDELPQERVSFYDAFPFEYPAWGAGNFREPCLRVRAPSGGETCELFYESHRIYPGKPPLEGLPAAYGGEGACDTLEILCRDPALGLQVTLLYTAFSDVDAICRSVRVQNSGGAPLDLTAVLSASLELDNQNFDLVTLHGSWAREREIDRRPLTAGKSAAFSLRGISSHQYHPFLALCEHSATQERGLSYGMTFVYSGNFLAQAELDQFDKVRAVMGIHPDGFTWRLEPGASFQAPEVLLTCSDRGLGGMSRNFHDLLRRHLIRGQDKPRPTLVNSWEACYFDFDHDKLLELGREAAEYGIELLVVDDGWFGKRTSETSSLGDWHVNEERLPGGLKRLGEELANLGVGLGIWVEPEMISPDSDLFRAHPDYAMAVPERTPTLARSQYVLDLTRKEVRDSVYGQIANVLRSAPISYVKWDMNRPLTDVYSAALPPHRQGEAAHRYILGLYEMQERLVTDFPEILLENCCSGGGRFDAGMLYYSPQIWCSDNAEAIDRLSIQEATALVYPLSSMGAHVACCPSHTNGRITPFETRGRVSLPGCFGYELNIGKLTEEERALIPRQLEEYRQYGPLFRSGDYYRLASFRENGYYDAFMAVSKDRSAAIVSYTQVRSRAYRRSLRLGLAGLEDTALYRDRHSGEVRSGLGWMRGGALFPAAQADFLSMLLVLERV